MTFEEKYGLLAGLLMQVYIRVIFYRGCHMAFVKDTDDSVNKLYPLSKSLYRTCFSPSPRSENGYISDVRVEMVVVFDCSQGICTLAVLFFFPD